MLWEPTARVLVLNVVLVPLMDEVPILRRAVKERNGAAERDTGGCGKCDRLTGS